MSSIEQRKAWRATVVQQLANRCCDRKPDCSFCVNADAVVALVDEVEFLEAALRDMRSDLGSKA